MAMVERAQPYVERLLEDSDLQQDLRELATALRGTYGRAEKKRKKPSRLAGDRKFKQNAQRAGESLRDAAMRFRGEPPKKSHRLRKLVVAAVVVGAAVYAGRELMGSSEPEIQPTPPAG